MASCHFHPHPISTRASLLAPILGRHPHRGAHHVQRRLFGGGRRRGRGGRHEARRAAVELGGARGLRDLEDLRTAPGWCAPSTGGSSQVCSKGV